MPAHVHRRPVRARPATALPATRPEGGTKDGLDDHVHGGGQIIATAYVPHLVRQNRVQVGVSQASGDSFGPQEHGSDDTNEIRPKRQYTVDMREECGGEDTVTITVSAGTEDEQDKQACVLAKKELIEWVRGGDYGHEGASVSAYYTLSDDEYEWPETWIEVEIEPDEEYLMKQAGADRDCDHEWTAEGEGGLRQKSWCLEYWRNIHDVPYPLLQSRPHQG